MRYAYIVFGFLVVLVLSIAGFRGSISTKPPIEIFDDMDRQPKYKAQSRSQFFADGRTDRPLPTNVVARGHLEADDHTYRGKNADGSWAKGWPAQIAVTNDLLDRGAQRYSISCLPCHGAAGDGNGITKSYGMVATPTFHDDRLRNMNEGEIFNTITNGKGTMMSYGDKITAEDRWAIIAYVRALQRAQNGSVKDVPQANRATLGIQ